ncbi:MAG: DUF4363 family protein [Bacillota bacterium]|jgi:hypothetical protein
MKDTSNTQTPTNHRLYFYLGLTAVLLLGICLGSYYYLKNTSYQVISSFPQLEAAITEGDWQEANIHFTAAQQTWDKHKNIWQCFLLHQEIDDIESMFHQLKGYLETNNATDSLSSIYKLEYNINHVPDTEKISFYNIL